LPTHFPIVLRSIATAHDEAAGVDEDDDAKSDISSSSSEHLDTDAHVEKPYVADTYFLFLFL
jgi:hypothetical protein